MALSILNTDLAIKVPKVTVFVKFKWIIFFDALYWATAERISVRTGVSFVLQHFLNFNFNLLKVPTYLYFIGKIVRTKMKFSTFNSVNENER